MNIDDNKKILERFNTDSKKSQENLHSIHQKNSSNPIKKVLIKACHTELNKNKFEYKSFSRFKPEDLR